MGMKCLIFMLEVDLQGGDSMKLSRSSDNFLLVLDTEEIK